MSRADMQNNSEVTERSVLEPFETETETAFQESNRFDNTRLKYLFITIYHLVRRGLLFTNCGLVNNDSFAKEE